MLANIPGYYVAGALLVILFLVNWAFGSFPAFQKIRLPFNIGYCALWFIAMVVIYWNK